MKIYSQKSALIQPRASPRSVGPMALFAKRNICAARKRHPRQRGPHLVVAEAQLLAEVVGLGLHLRVERGRALELEAERLELVLA